MFDLSWSEILLIAVVALIVIGPKDLPRVLKTGAHFARKARTLAREFQSGLEEMSREVELDSLKKDIDEATSGDLGKHIENSIDPGGEITKQLDIQAADAAASAQLPPGALEPPKPEAELASAPVAAASSEAVPVETASVEASAGEAGPSAPAAPSATPAPAAAKS